MEIAACVWAEVYGWQGTSQCKCQGKAHATEDAVWAVVHADQSGLVMGPLGHQLSPVYRLLCLPASLQMVDFPTPRALEVQEIPGIVEQYRWDWSRRWSRVRARQ